MDCICFRFHQHVQLNFQYLPFTATIGGEMYPRHMAVIRRVPICGLENKTIKRTFFTRKTVPPEHIASFLQDKRIAIVGGGPGGLSLARLLQMRGANVTVYERGATPSARLSGGSLDLHPSTGQATIKAAGLESKFRKVARPEGDRHTVLDKAGTVRLDIPALKFLSLRPEIDRSDLRDLLLHSLHPDTVHWGHHCVNLIGQHSKGRILQFSDGTEESADLIIACDGAYSKLRRFVTDIRPTYSGVSVLQGEVEKPEQQCPEVFCWVDKGSLIAMGDGKNVMAQQKSDGHLVVYVSFRQTEDWVRTCNINFEDTAQVQQWILQLLPDWNPIFHDLVKQAIPLVPRALYGTLDNEQWETQPDLTLLGDAAHVMPPFSGEGANMAMRDALDLANQLSDASHSHVYSALAAYEKQMLERTGKEQHETRQWEDIFHSPDGIDKLLRMIFGPMTPLSTAVPRVIRTINRVTDWLGYDDKYDKHK